MTRPSPIDGALFSRIREIWTSARSDAARSVNTAHVVANWLIGQQIVEAEQLGAARAAYGSQLIANLSVSLTTEFGPGFSGAALKNMRQFYLGYPGLIRIGDAPPSGLGSPALDSGIGYALRSQSSGAPDGSGSPAGPEGRPHPEVLAKRDAAVRWCELASGHSAQHGGKPWAYRLIPHDVIKENMTLAGLGG